MLWLRIQSHFPISISKIIANHADFGIIHVCFFGIQPTLKKKIMRKLLLLLAVFILFFNGAPNTKIIGYKPVYVPQEEAKIIKSLPPQEYKEHGKIYIQAEYIYIGENYKGVHIIDNSNPLSPQKIGFIQIYGNHDIAIKGNTLYADNLSDLVLIDLTDKQNAVVLQRIENVYALSGQNYPENKAYHTYFECVDPEKGIVVGWEETELLNPECFTTY